MLGVGCSNPGLFTFYHAYPRERSPAQKSDHCRLRHLWFLPDPREHEWNTPGCQEVLKKAPFLSPFPLFSISQLSRCPLPLKDDLTMSSFNNGFFKLSSLQLTVLLFCCQGDVPRRAPHTCSGSPPPSPPSGTFLHPFVTQSFLSWSQTFKITFILEQKKVPPITAQLLFTTQAFKVRLYSQSP